MAEINNNILPQESQIKKSGFSGFMSKLFGWNKTKTNNIEMVNVDIGSKERISQAMMNNFRTEKLPMSEHLDDLFNRWMVDNTDKITELIDRKQRIDQLEYMRLNDPYVNKTVEMYADEATQLDSQDTVIQIETPDPNMTRDMYDLLTKWGVTQPRIHSTIKQIGTFGDGFWANKITENGVERIIPLQQHQVSDRIEFNPIKVLEMKKRREGSFSAFASNNFLISKMIEEMESRGDFTEMFNKKLFGFMIDDDLVVPPWCITHFRVDADGSQFSPWGESPILGAIAPFKQTQSSIALQSLSKMNNFPITLFKVKTSDAMDPGRQFGVVNRVREAFDNIGVNPQVGSSEVYTNNTKIWLPDGLVTVEVVKNDSANSNNVDDISLYQDREAMALGLPKAFFGDSGWYSGDNSGKALTRQYKPFARKVFTLQTAVTEGLSDLFRIHFAITGIYDYRTPFTISMKYPAVEESNERLDTEKSSMELASNVIDLVKGAIGVGEDEGLPPDIVRDIIANYTFLKPNDIMKWTRDAKFSKNLGDQEGGSSDEGSSFGSVGDSDLGGDLGNDFGGDELESSSNLGDENLGSSDELSSTEEPTENSDIAEESIHLKRNRLREKELISKYKEKRNTIYFKALKENAISEFVKKDRHVFVSYRESDQLDLMLKVLNDSRSNNQERLHEGFVKRNSKKKKVNK